MKPPMFASASFLPLIVIASAGRNCSRAISREAIGELRLALLDEVRVFSEAAGVDDERRVDFVGERRHLADVRHDTGCPAAELFVIAQRRPKRELSLG